MQTPAEKYGLPTPSTDWGRDGNALFIVGAVRRALKDAGYPPEALREFGDEALSGEWKGHTLRTLMASSVLEKQVPAWPAHRTM